MQLDAGREASWSWWLAAREVWEKTARDIELGRAGAPLELDEVDLSDVLLVEVFGFVEQHGESAQAQVRGIHNFRANRVNDCALMIQKLKYDGFDHMLSALRELSAVCTALAQAAAFT